MDQTTLEPGLFSFDENELLTYEEIQDYGVYATRVEMGKEFEIELEGITSTTIPNFFIRNGDMKYVILVKTELLPRMGRLDPNRKSKLLHTARTEGAKALFASVGLGSMDLERRACGIALRHDAYFIKTQGYEAVEPLVAPTAAPGSPRFRAECCEMIGDAYHEGAYEGVLSLLSDDCRIYGQWRPKVMIGRQSIEEHYKRRVIAERRRYWDTDYRIVTILGLKRHPQVDMTSLTCWPQGPASHGFPCLRGDICLLKIDHEMGKPDQQTLFAIRFNERHQIRRMLVTDAGFYDVADFDPFPILEPTVN